MKKSLSFFTLGTLFGVAISFIAWNKDWMSPDRPLHIRRVIGLPGDRVEVEGKDIYVNGNKSDHIQFKQDEN